MKFYIGTLSGLRLIVSSVVRQSKIKVAVSLGLFYSSFVRVSGYGCRV